MGGAGADVAIEASDMVIQGDSLSQLPVGVTVARKTVGIARENIIFAIAVKLLIILGCAVGIFDENAMWLAVFGDVGVCLLAVANAAGAAYPQEEKSKNRKSKSDKNKKKGLLGSLFFFCLLSIITKNSWRFCAYFFLTNGGAGVLFSVKRKR